ncbi:hypothetical protein M5C99_05395 [Acidovorax sp. NCPPB 2350]|nr:hypothetical protein M5C99_05395 [Acidovorax sp. NCPPB 2350]
MGIDQITIALFGALAAWMSQACTDNMRRWACILTLGQPAWFHAAWKAQQWGVFSVCVIYCGAWLRAVWVYWVAPRAPGVTVGTVTLPPESRVR